MKFNYERKDLNKNSEKFKKKENKAKQINLITSIKSLYIIKYIFSFVTQRKKLNLMIYNKKLQVKLNIDIDFYKKISGRYINIDKDGNGKEYILNKNILLFSGSYLKGKRNGHGKEYHYNSKIKFEGEYLNGKILYGIGYDYNSNIILQIQKDRLGQELYINDEIKFKGEYINGKRWNGKGYSPEGKMEYELKDGKGYVKEYHFYKGDLIYEGEYANGDKNGFGKEYFQYNLIYEGEYFDGEKNGKGKEYFKHGQVKYEGNFYKGKRSGLGKIYYHHYNYNYYQNLRYEGEFLNGRKNGKGKEYFNCYELKIKFKGEYLNSLKWNGIGYNIDGDEEYELINGKGYVIEYDINNELLYEGEYLNGKRNGPGKIYKKGKLIFEGNFVEGRKKGPCKEYYGNGILKFEGVYL